jgi:hypothetical protein
VAGHSGSSIGASKLTSSDSAASTAGVAPGRSVASSSAVVSSALNLESFTGTAIMSAQLVSAVGPSLLVSSALDIVQVESSISTPPGSVDTLSSPFSSAHVVGVHLSAEYITGSGAAVSVVVTDITPSSVPVYLNESSRRRR